MGLSKAQRKAWWRSLTPEQKKAYQERKVAEQKAKRVNEALDAEFRSIVQ